MNFDRFGALKKMFIILGNSFLDRSHMDKPCRVHKKDLLKYKENSTNNIYYGNRGNYFRVLGVFVVLVLLINFFDSQVYSYDGVPDKVRIGLLFNDSIAKQTSAVSRFTVDNKDGLRVGYSKGNTFTSLIEVNSSNHVFIRKDAFFLTSGGGFKEYTPSENPPGGEKIGGYHVRIGGNYESYNALKIQLDEIRKKGVDAYPVFVDNWQIWTGFYSDLNEAQMTIMNSLLPAIGNLDMKVVEPSSTRIVVNSVEGQVLLMFGGTGYFQVHSINGSALRINQDDKTRYRGALEVRRFDGSDMTVINVVNIEDYLYGVVPYEIGSGSHMEALKAQAVAARTYTVNNLSKYKRLDFNLCATVSSQVYKGIVGETSPTNKAVDETRGKILTYNGKPAATFYFSSSGGYTEDVKNVWGSDSYPYLKSVEDKYESGKSWNYIWKVSYSAQKIKEILIGRGFDIGDISGIYITKKSEAGRAVELIVKGTKGERVYKNSGTRDFLSLNSQWFDITTDIDCKALNNTNNIVYIQPGGKKVMSGSGIKEVSPSLVGVKILGAGNVIKSVNSTPVTYTFSGRGWGHGIGMSQEGAKGMALAGFKYEEILTHYFPGTKVE